MSSGLDTATRRQIRKAFGPIALDVIQAHEAGMMSHAALITQLLKRITALEAYVAARKGEVTE